jgi:DNA-binding transcriptional MocR family regulator
VKYVFIEDTGKTWSALDLKVGVIAVSSDLLAELETIHNDILLNVSPFVLEMLRRYIVNSLDDTDQFSFVRLVQQNRSRLNDATRETILVPSNPSSQISVEWMRIVDGGSASSLCESLRKRGLHLLPGTQFYWSSPDIGDHFVRVALMRDAEMFSLATKLLADCLSARERSS